jgi:8-oxo-dGTP pyrophosphatase MutT (NUDIX family)
MSRLRRVGEGERSAGVVVVRRVADGWRFLILRAYRNWDFPKGLIEPGEDPLAAAVRETREEAGIEDLVFAWGHAFCETEPYARGKIARYYLAETRQERIALPISPALGRPEHHEFRWVGAAEARRVLPPRLQPILVWARSLLEI